jgi:hypothetical protein
MSDHGRLIPAQVDATAVRSCWMCGIRLPASQLVADGGSACADVRWYCQDTRACTQRWTSRSARQADPAPGAAQLPEPPGSPLTAWPQGAARLREVPRPAVSQPA